MPLCSLIILLLNDNMSTHGLNPKTISIYILLINKITLSSLMLYSLHAYIVICPILILCILSILTPIYNKIIMDIIIVFLYLYYEELLTLMASIITIILSLLSFFSLFSILKNLFFCKNIIFIYIHIFNIYIY